MTAACCQSFAPKNATSGSTQLKIPSKSPRVTPQILVRTELGRIDVNAHTHPPEYPDLLSRRRHQAYMPFVQISHCRHERDGNSSPSPGTSNFLHSLG